MKATLRFIAATLAGLGVLSVTAVQAQSYPQRPVNIIVPWPAGGLVDVLARSIAERLRLSLGQSFIVENKTGAGGNIGTDQLARAAGDGYTLGVATSAHAMNASLHKQLPFDPVNDFVPISIAAYAPSIIVVHPAVPAKTLQDFIALARSKPGKMSYASAGSGSPAHLYAELLNSTARIDMLHVPYKGAPPAMTDLLAGRVDMLFANSAVAISQVNAGKVRALAVTSAKRLPLLPEVPTVSEAGVPGYEAVQWLGFLAPKGTPEAVVKLLNAEIRKALQHDGTRQTLEKLGMEVAGTSAEEFARVLKQDIDKWAQVVQRAGVKPE